MRTDSMQLAFDRLVGRFGESSGRTMFVWLCQRWGVSQSNECPAGMMQNVVEGAALWYIFA